MLKPLRPFPLPQWRSAGVLHLNLHGSATITAYRIFYGNEENVSVLSTITGIVLSSNEDSVDQHVSLHSEADQLTSQLINVTVTGH